MVWDAGLKLNVPLGRVRQLFDFEYFLLGPNFSSLGNENLVADKAGFEVSEEVRLLDGKARLRGSFEYFHDNLARLKTTPSRSYEFRLAAAFMWAATLPSATVNVAYNDEAGRVSDTAAADNRNRLNSTGLTVQYSKKLGVAANTFALSYNNSLSRIASENLPRDISFRINTVMLSAHTRYDDTPLESRTSLSANISRGEYGVNLLSALLGLTWHIIADVMHIDIDGGYDYAHNYGQTAENELSLRSGLNYDITQHHSVWATVSVSKMFGTAYVSPSARASYEFRF